MSASSYGRVPTDNQRTQAGGQPLTVVFNIDGDDILAIQADTSTTLGVIWQNVVAATSTFDLDGPEFVDIRIASE